MVKDDTTPDTGAMVHVPNRRKGAVKIELSPGTIQYYNGYQQSVKSCIESYRISFNGIFPVVYS